MPYILNGEKEKKAMLEAIGAASIGELFAHLPPPVLAMGPAGLGPGLSELEVKKHLSALARENRPLESFNSFLGAGYYDHYVPAAVDFILSHSQFLTAYTPYQAECSQGILQAIYEYQTYISILTGMDAANASLFDGASSAAESALMAMRLTRRDKIVVAGALHPEYLQVVNTYLKGLNSTVRAVNFSKDGLVDFNLLKDALDDTTAAVILQSPNFFGLLEDVHNIATIAKSVGALTVAVVNPFSLGLLRPPAGMGADIVCGEGQPLGGSLNFGGPGFGFMAVRKEYLRQMPGRIVGRSKDLDGNTAYCLTLAAREQHIRREKATSNICSNHSFNAIAAAVYFAVVGKEGFKRAAALSFSSAQYLYKRLKEMRGVRLVFSDKFFNEFVWEIDNARKILNQLREKGIVAGYYLGKDFPAFNNCVLTCCTEKKTKEEIDSLVNTLALILHG